MPSDDNPHQVAEHVMSKLERRLDGSPGRLGEEVRGAPTVSEALTDVALQGDALMHVVMDLAMVIDHLLLELRQAGVDIDLATLLDQR